MNTEACETCPIHNAAILKKLGVGMDDWDYVIALAGTPNTGKSTVFNQLTGLKQHTGNWPGKTVARAEGGFSYNEKKYKLIDLPGTYSLLSTSEDEEIARDFILFGKPDATVMVLDSTRLERNLNLVLQILEITSRGLICLNLMDEAERRGLEVDIRSLSRDLGVPVIPTIARTGEGIPELLKTIQDVAAGTIVPLPHILDILPEKIESLVREIEKSIEEEFPDIPNARWIALRLLEGDATLTEAVRDKKLGDLVC